MESKLKLFGHPIHPMLVVFPVGLFVMSVLFDILYLLTRNPDLAIASYYMIVAGLIGGVLAAIFGAIDWLGLPYNSRAWNMGIGHGIGNFVVLGLFLLTWLRRRDNTDFIPETATLLLSALGLGLLLVTAWMGGELIYRLGVAVDRGANVNAPNSLTERSPEPSNVEHT
ncbi:MAG: DUF2231 domain-containing protein [Chloroflexota bacterium]|nr:DUF2231 domain-containing protein [Chloroflexota bacterium]